ncbi:hypothetical protein CspeluHIS016_0303380 [Cutaneotrichosporon spelunceum]|uniref:Uncharacterized protein n=1 Tax=Cutaneotrichosporon spelunceum TaxID=1672016 RepID=A0AAD3YBV8_9TREE|nr:hypothetical protein CspeluHIS016_0303380 [Cutaneotrichosporon spelunceum]
MAGEDKHGDLASRLILHIAKATRFVAPWTSLPLATASIAVEDLIENLTGRTVHSAYFPFVRFSVLHAARVTIAWVAMTNGRKQVGLFADLFGFLGGGSTLVSLLSGSPPAWLLSPAPWLVYVAIYLIAVPTKLASVVSQAPSLPLGLVLSFIDGMARGVTVASMPSLTESSPKTAGSWLAPIVLGVIATCGGGWIAQTLGLARESWTIGRPSVLGGGVWDTLDVWAAVIAGVVYSALVGNYPALRKLRPLVVETLPSDLEITPGVARAVAVLVFTSLFAARTIATCLRPATKEAEKRIQAKTSSLPEKAAVPSENVTNATPAQTPEPKTHRRSTRSSRAATPATVSPASEDTSSKPRKRRAKKKKNSAA